MGRMEGKLVRLRPIREEDCEYFASMKNDMWTQSWNQRLPPNFTPEKVLKSHRESNEKKNSASLAIETLDGVLVGHIGYHEDLPRHDATFGLTTGKEHWGKGYGQEAQEIILRFLFEERGIQIVRLWTQTGFPWAQKAAEKLGFKVCVRFRENTIIDGQIHDSLYMDMLRSEYYESRKLEDSVGEP